MWSMSHRAQRIAGCLAASAVVLAVGLTVRVVDPEPVAALRDFTFDNLQRLSPRPYEAAPVRIVDIDELSLREVGQWPWPRTRVAEVVERLSGLGAAAIAFDMVFPEPDRTSPQRAAASLALPSDAIRDQIRTLLAPLPDHDEVFADVLRRAPVVLGFATSRDRSVPRPPVRSGFALAGTPPTAFLEPFQGAVVNLNPLDEAAKGHGTLDRSRERTSGITRRVPGIVSDGERLYLGLGLEALRVAQGEATTLVRSNDASGEGRVGSQALVDVRVGAARIPLTAEGEFLVYFDHNRRERYVSASALLSPERSAALRPLIEGHIIFIGSSAAGLLDATVTPLGEQVPGVMVHAQATEQILSGRFLSRPDWATGFELASMVFWSTLVAVLLAAVGARFVAGVIAAVIALIVTGTWLAFAEYGFLLDPTFTGASAIGVYFAASAVLYLTADREKRFIRQAFGQYLAPEVLTRLERSPHLLALGGETRVLTVMFMDIRGFTSISEHLSAHELTAFLNEVLSPLSDEIIKQQGTIDKYIGDSIMAFWNAPVEVEDHAARACRAALSMQATVRRLNDEDAFGFRKRWNLDLRLEVGIGLNTGEASVGNMGSEHRFNYSAVGDTVNAAARIESSCKAIGWPLLISETTRARAHAFAALEVGSTPLRGRSEPMRLYALLGDETLGATSAFRTLARQHQELLEAIDQADRSAALEALLACRLLAGTDLASLYEHFLQVVGQGSPGRNDILESEKRPRPAGGSSPLT
jgi:adenylate cyclase